MNDARKIRETRPTVTETAPSQPRRAAIAGLHRAPGAPFRAQVPHRPIHPGRFLQTRFLTPLRISQIELAVALAVSRRRVNELLRGHRGITADTALRLGLYFEMDPHFWLGLQMAWELHQAAQQRAQGAAGAV
ncbi:MAG: HigA family addiction module antidote protein [Betaproteobacteria bacterium]|nr:HigA family addiction module antidote protein [Betaproteobacteria bacterium]